MDSDREATRNLLRDAAERGIRYLDALAERPVGARAEAVAALSGALEGGLPEDPTNPGDVVALLDEVGSPATTANAGGRYFGFVTGGALPASLAANWLAGAWDQNGFGRVSSPAAALIEDAALRWSLEALGLPPTGTGALVTGATMANFTCLAAARHRVLTEAGWDVEKHGLFGAPEVTVVIGAESHATLPKVLGLLGLGRERVVRVPADRQGRLVADSLPEIDGPAILCLQAGNVNSGAFDPAPEAIAWARARKAWVHVDGAFGLWALAAPSLAPLCDGYQEADSWATDAHKWLNVPYDCGLALVRDPSALHGAMAITAAYLELGAEREAIDFTPESSRRARAVEVWAALKSLGRSGLAAMIERNCRQARRFAEGLAAAGAEILNDVVLNQVVVAFGEDEQTQAVVARVQEEGTCWCGGTSWQGRAAMRISVSSWATTDDDVERSLEAIIKVADL